MLKKQKREGYIYENRIPLCGTGNTEGADGKALYETYPTAKAMYDSIHLDDIDVKDLCFNGDLATLSQTSNTQPCMVATAAVITELLKEEGIIPDFVAGFESW